MFPHFTTKRVISAWHANSYSNACACVDTASLSRTERIEPKLKHAVHAHRLADSRTSGQRRQWPVNIGCRLNHTIERAKQPALSLFADALAELMLEIDSFFRTPTAMYTIG